MEDFAHRLKDRTSFPQSNRDALEVLRHAFVGMQQRIELLIVSEISTSTAAAALLDRAEAHLLDLASQLAMEFM